MRNAMQSKFMLAAVAVLSLSVSVLPAQQPSQGSGQVAAPAPAARTDGQIEMDVVQALDASAALKNDLITAATIQGKVTLAGTVVSDADKRLAESLVAKVPGVVGVQNNLKVGNPADDANAAGIPEDNTSPPEVDDQQPPAAPGQQPNPGNPPQAQGYPQQGQQPPPPPAQGQNYPQRAPYPQPQYGQQPGYPPPPPGYGQGYPPPPPGYAPPYAPRSNGYATAKGPITMLEGTVLQVRTNDSLGEKGAKDGQPVDFTVIRDVAVNGYLAIPRGAIVHGVVSEVKHAGALTGAPELALRATALDIDGRVYPIDSDQFKVRGPNKTGHTVGDAIGGALIGAIIGGAAGRGEGAAIGAAAGGTAGTALSAAGSPHVWIPAEALVVFHLNSPVTVDPVSREVATRLSQGLYPGGPTLYRRPAYYGPSYYYGPAGPGYYAYPPVYYRPYYMVGGAYYWR